MRKKTKSVDAPEAAKAETAEQADLDISTAAPAGPVECLGMTFPSDAARREHFLKELRACPGAADIQAGDVVTTGTWTDAYSVDSGQTWRASFDMPVSSLALCFEG